MSEPVRGHLKIYMGYAAGVGKTYRMLEEAQALRRDSVDIVVGYFEPHGRKETIAMTEGLEFVPRRTVRYNNAAFEEMDTDAVLRRRPKVAVVDEFAHTNVPGSERVKRWQDVHALLDAGIDVIATMNVQHLESLNDQVWHITGVRVRETVPDWVIDDADEIVFVDLTPQALRNRLERGVVYSPDKAQKAMDNFFTETNLAALREMAMRHTAHELEDKLTAAPQAPVVDILATTGSAPERRAEVQPPRKERILICLTGNPFSAVLIRRGKRVADYLQADCVAIHVAAHGEDHDAIERHLSFARNLRIETHVVYAAGVSRAIADFARQQGITQIVMGRSAPRPWYQRRETVVQAVAAHSREMQVIIVASRRR